MPYGGAFGRLCIHWGPWAFPTCTSTVTHWRTSLSALDFGSRLSKGLPLQGSSWKSLEDDFSLRVLLGGISWNHGPGAQLTGSIGPQSDLGPCHGRYKNLEEKLNSFSSKPSHDLELGRKAWSDVWDGHPVPWHACFGGDWHGNTSRKMHGIIVM